MASLRALSVFGACAVLVNLATLVSLLEANYVDPIDSVGPSILQLFGNDSSTKRDGFSSFLSAVADDNQAELRTIFCSNENENCPLSCFNESQLWEHATRKSKGDGVDLEGFKAVCPALLVQSRLSCGKEEPRPTKSVPSAKAWGFGILFVTLISLCSLVGASVLPLMGQSFYHHLLTVLIGLAVGSLFGSSVFHLIPQAYGIMDPEFDPDHGYLNISLLIFGGFWLFFMIERMLKIIMEVKERKAEAEGKEKKKQLGGENHQMQALNSPRTDDLCVPIPFDDIYESQEQVIKASFGHMKKPKKQHHGHEHVSRAEGKNAIATVAWMIVFGDGLHNFIDGLSIGAAFSESISTGISISVAVLCEELPHELGDFAVLLASGMSMKQALLYNFLSACTCYLGLAVGIMLGEIEASVYIFALAGGMFLYISLTDMVPELNEVAEASSKVSVCEAMKVLTLQNIGIFIGVFALFVLAKFQDSIVFNF